MKISVKYIKIGRKKPLKDQKLVYHALVVPVMKNVWYFTVDFKVRTEVEFYGNDGEFDQQIYIPVHEEKRKTYAVITVDASKEGHKIEFYGRFNKTNYNGLIIKDGLISKAWDRFNNRFTKAWDKKNRD